MEDLQPLADAIEIKKYVDTVNDQIKHLKTAVEHTIELNKNKVRGDVTEGECCAKVVTAFMNFRRKKVFVTVI